jgi:hypothetical protein
MLKKLMKLVGIEVVSACSNIRGGGGKLKEQTHYYFFE